MAKEKENKKSAENAPTAVTVDNIREKLDKASLARTELAEDVLKKIQEEKDENTKSRMKNRIQQANYKVDETLLKLRYQRDIADIQKQEMAHVGRLKRFLCGFEVTEQAIEYANGAPDTIFNFETVDKDKKTIAIKKDGKETVYKIGDKVPPLIDYVDYDNYKEKVKEFVRKATQEADKVRAAYNEKLRAAYGEYWNSEWRY